MAPFRALPKVTGKLPQGDPANQSIKQLVTLSQQAGFPEIGLLFQTMFLRPVRNAFYHSDYILTGESFNIRWGEGVKIGSMISSQVRLDWLLERVNLGINTALSTLELLLEHIRSYRESKIVKGRLAADGSWVDVELFTDPSFGLTGFQTPPRPKPHPTEETERDLGSKTRSESPTRERSTPDFDLS